MAIKVILPDTALEVVGKVTRVDRDELGMQYDMGIEFMGLPHGVKKRLSQYLELTFTGDTE